MTPLLPVKARIILALCVLLLSLPSSAQTTEMNNNLGTGLTMINDTADKICGNIPLYGTADKKGLTLEGQGLIKDLIKRLALNFGFAKHDYHGLPQDQLRAL